MFWARVIFPRGRSVQECRLSRAGDSRSLTPATSVCQGTDRRSPFRTPAQRVQGCVVCESEHGSKMQAMLFNRVKRQRCSHYQCFHVSRTFPVWACHSRSPANFYVIPSERQVLLVATPLLILRGSSCPPSQIETGGPIWPAEYGFARRPSYRAASPGRKSYYRVGPPTGLNSKPSASPTWPRQYARSRQRS